MWDMLGISQLNAVCFLGLFVPHCWWEASRFKIHRLGNGMCSRESKENSSFIKSIWKYLNCIVVWVFFFFFQIVSVLTGKFASFIKECVIIDCRYPYEYEGGHIKVCCWLCKSNVELSEVASWAKWGHLAPCGALLYFLGVSQTTCIFWLRCSGSPEKFGIPLCLHTGRSLGS